MEVFVKEEVILEMRGPDACPHAPESFNNINQFKVAVRQAARQKKCKMGCFLIRKITKKFISIVCGLLFLIIANFSINSIL